MRTLFLFLAASFIISCSKVRNGIPSPINPLNKENIDTVSNEPWFLDSDYYDMINRRNKIEIEKTKKKMDILIELNFPEDIYFSHDNKYVLYIREDNAWGDYYMYMGKVQKHIYLKNYPYIGNIECPKILIQDLTDSIHYYWSPSKDDYPFRFHGNKITVFLSSHTLHPIYKQGKMSDEEQTIMNMQPDFIEYIHSKSNILYKDYMDSIHRNLAFL